MYKREAAIEEYKRIRALFTDLKELVLFSSLLQEKKNKAEPVKA